MKSFKAVAEKLTPETATVTVTVAGHGAPRGVEPWSIREMLTTALKN